MLFFNKIKNKTSDDKDKADGSLVFFLLSVPLLILVISFCINVNKNINVGNTFKSMAQVSAEAGVKESDSQGSLTNDSVAAFLREYRRQASIGDTKAFHDENCSTMMVDGKMRALPYVVVKLGTARGADDQQSTVTWTVEGNNELTTQQLPAGQKYRVISADVYDSSKNFFDIFGTKPCQLHKSTVSAISFGSNSDVTQ